MSTTIDQRVVEMRFDNRNFESNVQTSMSTLEKLKQRLNLTGATKGLENVDSAAKKVNLGHLGVAADTVGLKFNAMYTMADQALRNITTRVQHTAENLAKSFTIEPVKTGLEEYETQINAVQTILANTQHSGTTLNEVNTALDTLNTYADKTIYNFTEMTRNIGTFTAAGVDLQTSVESIQGIANLAAVSGSTSQQASTAMYQLSQALAAGKVSLMDWNSVVNAGMGGKVFQDALLRTSKLLKTGGEEAVKTYGSFRESLTKGEWLTTEVLTETLKQLSGAYTEADLIAKGFTKEQAKEITELAVTATDAATKVKTFTQLMDTLKEATQSGWTQTWEILIGDFEEAKAMWTAVSDTLGEIIGKSSDRRNKMLTGAMSSGWDKMITKIEDAGIEAGTFEAKLKTVLEKNGEDVEGLIKKYGSLEKAFQNGEFKTKDLKAALRDLSKTTTDLSNIKDIFKMGSTGDDVKKVQQALKDLNYDFSKYGIDGIVGEETTAAIKAFQELKGLTVDGIVGPETLKALEEASGSSSKLKGDIDELIEGVDELGGRQLLIESFANIWKGLMSVISPIRSAFARIFPPMTSEQLYKLIEGFHSFTEKLILNNEQAKKLRNTFKGIFALIDIVATITGGALKFAFEAVSGLLAGFDLDILDVTSAVADSIIKFRSWLKSTIDVKSVFEAIAPHVKTFAGYVKIAVKYIKQFFSEVLNMPDVQSAFANVSEIFGNFKKNIEDIFSILKGDFEFTGSAEEVGRNIAEGITNGLFDGAGAVWDAIVALAKGVITHFCEVLGIQSPSTVMEEKGENIIEGLLNGIGNIVGKVWDFFKNIATGIVDIFGDIDWRTIFAAGMGVSMLYTVAKFVNVLENITSPLDGIGDLLESFSRVSNAFAMKVKSQAIKNIATAIAILVGSLIALTLIVQNDWKSVGLAVVFIGALAGILIGLMFAMNKLNDASMKFEKGKGFNIDGLKSGLISIGVAVALLAVAVRLVGTMNWKQAVQGFVGLGIIVAAVAGVFLAFDKLLKGRSSNSISAVGGMLIKMSIAIGLLALVCKLAGSLNLNDALKGAAFVTGFLIFVAVLGKVVKGLASSDTDKLGGMLIKMSIAMGLLVLVCKLAGMLNLNDAINGALFAAAFVVFIKGLVWATKVSKGQEFAKLGGMLLSVSLSLLLLIGVCKLVGLLKVSEIVKAIAFVGCFLLFVKALISVLKIGSTEQIAKVGLTILALSASIAILAGVAIILGLVKLEDLAKGVIAVGLLGLIMKGMIAATKDAKDIKGTMIGLAVAIGVIALAVAALTFIEPAKLAVATIALSILMKAFGTMAKNAGTMGKVIGPLLVISAAVAMLAGVLYLIAKLPIQQSIGAAIALSILMLTMSGAMKIMSGIKPLAAKGIIAMAAIAAIVAVLGIVLGVLNKLDCNISLETALALSVLLLALSGACVILQGVGAVAGQAVMGAVALAGVILVLGGLIAAIGGLVTDIPQIQTFLDNGIPALEAIGKGIGKFIGGLIGSIGEGLSASFKAMMKDFADGVGYLSDIPTSAIDGAKNLVGIMGAMAGVNIADFISTLWTGETPIETFKTNVLAFADAMMGLSDKISGANIDVDAINSLASAGTSFATLNQSLPRQDGWIQDIVGSQDLAKFGESCKAFADQMILINDSVNAEGFSFNTAAFDAMASVGTQFSTLNASLPKQDGWVQDIVGEQSLTDFGASCKAFAQAMIDINSSVNSDGFSFNEEAFTAMATAGAKFSELNASLPKQDGWAQDILGEQSLTDFGASVVAFASAMMSINESVNTDSFSFNESAFTAMVTAGAKFSELNAALPKQDGWAQDILGEQSLTDFGASVSAFASAMLSINDAVSAEGFTFNESAFTSMVTAGTKIAELESIIPKSGGWWENIAGSTDISDFGERIKTFGAKMVEFTTGLADFDNSNVDTAISAATKLKDFIVGLSGIDTSGVDNFAGDASGWGEEGALSKIATAIANFGLSIGDINVEDVDTAATAAKKLKSLIASLVDLDTSGLENFKIDSIGTAIKNYGESVKDIDAGIVTASIAAANRLKNFINGLADVDASGISNFRPSAIGTAIKNYANNVSDINIESIDSSINAAKKIKNFISSLADLDTSGVSAFTSSISTLGEANVSGFTEKFSSASTQLSSIGSDMMSSLSKSISSNSSSVTSAASSVVDSLSKSISSKSSLFTTIGSSLITNLVKGIAAKSSDVKSSVISLVVSVSSGLSSGYTSFYNAGSYLVTGFANGISANSYIAAARARAMAKAAKDAAEDELDINSPSRVFYGIGDYAGQGFINALTDNVSKSYKAGSKMAESAKNGLKEAMARASEFINGDIETQPTIRPVLDLSDVKSGASVIGNMFNAQHTVGVAANLNAINTSMNVRSQNGVNSDVVSAIDKLSKQLNNIGGNTYNLNGITYDDGSNVSNAVSELIRAIRIEGRV